MSNTNSVQSQQSTSADGVLTITLSGVKHPHGGVDGFPLPTRYKVHPPAHGEMIAGQPIAGWLHTGSMLWAHQGMAVYRDLERLGLGVMEWDDSTLGRNDVPPCFRIQDGVTMQALLPLDQDA